VESAEEQPGHNQVARQDQGDPAGRQGLQGQGRWRQVQPDQGRDRGIEQVPGQEIARVAEQPFQNAERLRRPDENRRIFDQLEGLPVAPLVTLAVTGVIHGAILLERSAAGWLPRTGPRGQIAAGA
jgi:hypothetical protein